jgi:hypothetical protein
MMKWSAIRSLVLTLLLLLASSSRGIPLEKQQTFGHSIKNGKLPAHTEVTTFEHNCTRSP